MILDDLKNAKTYEGISERIKTAIAFLQREDLEALEVGKHNIDEERIFVLIQEYETKPVEEGNCEAHKRYIDIQYIISGVEQMGYAPVEDMEIIEAYSDEKDRYFVKWEGTFTTYTKGMFAIFFPQDAHMPGISVKETQKVKKAVVKILV